MLAETVTIHGKSYTAKDFLNPWLNRKEQAEKEMKTYLPQIRVNRMFAAGKQHLDLNKRDGRVIEVRTRNGIELITSNLLDQYLMTAMGRMSSNDYKATFLVAQDNEQAEEIAQFLNMGFSWGWDNEWHGDEKVLDLLRYMAVDGTVAVRARYDRRYGEIVGDVPYKDGSPILDKDEASRYVAKKAGKGETADIQTLREGKVCWEMITADNMLPPPGYNDPRDFPWEMIRRPVSVAEIRNRYGKLAEEVSEEEIDNEASITAGQSDGSPTKLDGKAFVYTGYERPNAEYPEGCTVVFTNDALLDVRKSLPLSDHPAGPRTGLHYFRWTILPGRFIGKAFIENGIGGQKIYNKRNTQINAIIDRNMPKVYAEEQSLARPKTGEPMEIIEVRPGAPLPKTEQGVAPGAWMLDDIKMQVENVERAMGIRGVSMGQAPQGVSAYSAMALLTENDAMKLDPIGQDFRLRMIDLSWDTMEHMRNWPSDKRLNVVGPEGRLMNFLFESNKIPVNYIVKPPRGGALPRGQAAEIQKINDVWAASAGKLPLTWYIESLNQGKTQDLPPAVGDSDAHKAELENIIISNTQQPPPVAPYDDDARHTEIHRASQMEAQARLDAGDETAQAEVEAYENHILEHEASAKANQVPSLTPPMGVTTAASNEGSPGGASLAPAGMEGMGAPPTGMPMDMPPT